MSRRNRILLGTGVALAIVLALPYAIWHPRWLNHDGFQHIENGMTQAEVEQLLGGPPGIYYPAYRGGGGTMTAEGYFVPDAAETVWSDDERRYEVWFSDDGLVVGKHRRSRYRSESFSCRFLSLIHGAKEPSPLEPRRHSRSPAEPGKS